MQQSPRINAESTVILRAAISQLAATQMGDGRWVSAVKACSRPNTATVPRLLEALAHQSPSVRQSLAGVLVRLGSIIYYDIIDALRHKNATVRKSAAKILYGFIIRKQVVVQDAVPALTVALKDEAPAVRCQAAIDLCMIGKEAAAAVPALTEALLDDVPQVRQWASDALDSILENTKVVPVCPACPYCNSTQEADAGLIETKPPGAGSSLTDEYPNSDGSPVPVNAGNTKSKGPKTEIRCNNCGTISVFSVGCDRGLSRCPTCDSPLEIPPLGQVLYQKRRKKELRFAKRLWAFVAATILSILAFVIAF